MEDNALGLDRARDVDRVAHRRHRLLVEVVLRARQVHEIERVAEDALDPGLRAALLEPLEVLGRMVRRSPGPRALGEDLDGVGAHGLGAVDGGVDAA